MDEQSSPHLLTGFGAEARRGRGKPTPIADALLFSRRDRLLGQFEFHWSQFAWELQKAQSIPTVRKALLPIREPLGSEFEWFTDESTEITTPDKLRLKRRAEAAFLQAVRDGSAEQRRAFERLERAQGALRNTPSDERLETLCEERQAQCDSAAHRQQALTCELEQIRGHVRRQQAYIAQSDVLAFVSSNRYEINPLNTANALAGLPFINWRTSAQRCSKRAACHPHKFQYELFRRVERALGNPSPQTPEQALERMKECLLGNKHRDDSSVQRLKEEWYFLRCAIQHAFENGLEKGAMPYRVFAEYQRRTSRRDAYDLVMQEEEQL